ncbi:MAG: hypothetical protein N7Q72_07510, partial [Spiroplasma sp. Tabriz.8]|nr:hypothetical protein [Spiroplasma sp. Tabriz.8]
MEKLEDTLIKLIVFSFILCLNQTISQLIPKLKLKIIIIIIIIIIFYSIKFNYYYYSHRFLFM